MDARGGHPRAITHLNDAKVAAINWGETEQFSFAGAKGDKVYGWVTKPPNVALFSAEGRHGVPIKSPASSVLGR